jgi:aryl-alcohol dehydrogenase-like predicted oxidoreductase
MRVAVPAASLPVHRFVTEQPPYSILVRAIEADVLPTCRRADVAVMSYSPLAGGWLSGRWRKDAFNRCRYASAFALSESNSCCVIAPESSSSLALAISVAGPPPAVSRT